MATLTKIGNIVNKYPRTKNAIVNGNMNVKQNVSGYNPDKWYSRDGSVLLHTIDRSTNAPSGSDYSYQFVVDYADTVNSNTHYHLHTGIEGVDFAPFVGNVGTLSFYVYATVTGTFCVALRNANASSTADRSYIAEYTIDQVDTWQKKEISINFDYSGGTWDYDDGLGLMISFAVACGSTYHAPSAGSWLSGNYYATSNQLNMTETGGTEFYITQVQLELGPATSFEVITYQEELLRCFRYYQVMNSHVCGTATAGGQVIYNGLNWYCPMRTAPSVGASLVGVTNCGSQTRSDVSNTGAIAYSSASSSGYVESIYTLRISADVLS